MDQSLEPITEHTYRHLFFFGGPIFAYATLIFFLSSLSSVLEAIPSFLGFDKIIHFFEYFISAVSSAVCFSQ
jgi:hypothetical protein